MTNEKEIPKKVIYQLQRLNDRDFHVYKCPNCLSHLDSVSCSNYCGNCGQKLDWEEDEEVQKS